MSIMLDIEPNLIFCECNFIAQSFMVISNYNKLTELAVAYRRLHTRIVLWVMIIETKPGWVCTVSGSLQHSTTRRKELNR